MISTGNDIVDLHAIDRRRTLQPRFYSKILSFSEEALYRRQGFGGLTFEHFVWLLWSVKESAYKYRQRLEPDHIFSPGKIVVEELEAWDGDGAPGGGETSGEIAGISASGAEFYKGIVRSGSGIFYARSIINADYISTVVSGEESFNRVRWGAASIDRAISAEQSASVRALVLDELHALLPTGKGSLHIEKSPRGCPVVCRDGEETGISVSLAHHGRFIAYSLILTCNMGN